MPLQKAPRRHTEDGRADAPRVDGSADAFWQDTFDKALSLVTLTEKECHELTLLVQNPDPPFHADSVEPVAKQCALLSVLREGHPVLRFQNSSPHA